MKKPTTFESMAGPYSRDCSTRKSKQATILQAFYSGRSLNRFEAEVLGDHCLHTSVSTFTHCHGLMFERHSESVPNRFGSKTKVMRYRLAERSRGRAGALLKRWGVEL
jgi:hypothetical protein